MATASPTTKKPATRPRAAAKSEPVVKAVSAPVTPKAPAAPKAAPLKVAVDVPAGRYFEGIGRRKTAVARVRIQKGTGATMVNDKKLEAFFPIGRLSAAAIMPLTRTGFGSSFAVSVHVKGGGIMAQAEAIRHGLARALVIFDSNLKGQMRTLGYLTRDARMVERKKYGLKKARRSPSWSKR